MPVLPPAGLEQRRKSESTGKSRVSTRLDQLSNEIDLESIGRMEGNGNGNHTPPKYKEQKEESLKLGYFVERNLRQKKVRK